MEKRFAVGKQKTGCQKPWNSGESLMSSSGIFLHKTITKCGPFSTVN